MFNNLGELAIALSAERVFKDKYGTVMKFDPLGKEDCGSPFVCKHRHSNEWLVMTSCWFEYETVKEVFSSFTELPDLLRDTTVLVAMTSDDDFEPQYFSHFDENGNMLCFSDGKTSYTETYGRVTLWNRWMVCGGPHDSTRNFDNNKENKNV